jgi:hypothetical protein
MYVGEYRLVFILTRVNCGRMQLDIQIRAAAGFSNPGGLAVMWWA